MSFFSSSRDFRSLLKDSRSFFLDSSSISAWISFSASCFFYTIQLNYLLCYESFHTCFGKTSVFIFHFVSEMRSVFIFIGIHKNPLQLIKNSSITIGLGLA